MAKPSNNAASALALAIAGMAILVGGGWALYSLIVAPSASSSGSSAVPSPQTVEEILTAARTLMDQDKAPSAEVILAAAVAKYPASQQLRLLYGECLLQQERYVEALEQYDEGIFIGPDHPEYRFAAGTIASKAGRLEDAQSHYLAAQALDSRNPKYPLYLAQIQHKLGNRDDARANLVIATSLDPSLAIAWASLAAIALDENHPTMALSYIAKARALEPARPDWRMIEAKALRRDGDPQKAADLLLAIPQAQRVADVGILQELAMCLGMLGRHAEIAPLYVSAVSASPDNPELCFQAAYWLDREGQKGRAATYAQHAAAKGHVEAKKLLARVEAE